MNLSLKGYLKIHMYSRVRMVMMTLLMAVAMCVGVSAQPYCRVHTFDIHDGLPSNSIAGLVQSAENLLWVSTWNGLCYYDGYQFTTFRGGGEHGTLSSNRLRTVEPDNRGHVWLFSYDRVLYMLDTQTGRYHNISNLIADKVDLKFYGRNLYRAGDHVWVNSEDSPRAVRISTSDPENPDSIIIYDVSDYCPGSRQVHKVQYDSLGNEWIIGDKGVHLYGTDVSCRGRFVDVLTVGRTSYLVTADGRMYVYTPESGVLRQQPLPEWVSHVNTTRKVDDRHLLLGTDDGIAVYNIPNHSCAKVADGRITDLYVDGMRRVWAFGDRPGVILTDLQGTDVEVFTSEPVGDACTRSVRPLWVEDKYGMIWLVPKDGVFGYFDADERRIVPYPIQSPRFGRTNIQEIEKFFVDAQSNLWVTSTHDLIRINFGHYNAKRLPLVRNVETRALVALADGNVLAGSLSGVLGYYDGAGHLKGYLTPGHNTRLSSEPVRFSDRIYSLYQDSRGRVWVGTKGHGLYVIEQGGAVRHYVPQPGDRYSLNSGNVYDFMEDDKGKMWIATYGGGLNIIPNPSDVSALRFINASNELSTYPMEECENVRRVACGRKGEVLLSTTGGLVTCDGGAYTSPSTIKFYRSRHVDGDESSLRTNDVMQVLVARDGRVYVATMGGEMQRVDSDNLLVDNLKFAPMPKGGSEGALSYSAPEGGGILSMLEDADGNICAVRETSIVLYEIMHDRITVFGPNDLGETIEFTEGRPALMPGTGYMWLPTMGGLVSFHPNDIDKSDYEPNIVFTGVQFQGEPGMHHMLNAKTLDITDENRRTLAINFAALDFSDNYLLQYAYKFEGDDGWNYLQGSHNIQLSRLQPGHHRLLVKSTNSDGVWLDNEASLDIIVHPTFNETPWAILLYILIAGFVIWTGIHFYFLRKRNAMLSDMHRKESEFYTDVSHKLRTPLTLIGAPVREVLDSESLSETAQGHLRMVERNSERMLHLVDEMLRKSYDKGVYISDATVTGDAAADEAHDGAHESAERDPSKDSLLVVEDHDDLRAFLTDILSSQYNVISASNGLEGLKMAEEQQPDFILTDVTMPEMDGLTMVRNIKSNKALSHIPIIVLSAKASEQDRVLGLREGVDDYVTKPFSATYLRQRIASIIAQRRILQQSYLESLGNANASYTPGLAADTPPDVSAGETDDADTSSADYRLDTPQVVDADKEMMATLMDFINGHIEDEGLKIEELADSVNLGRTVFYGKIKALVGMTPSDFLRRMRMQRAEELIVKSRMNFSEIAFKVGFSDPKYFTKCFKKETGMTPSEYRQKYLTE